MDLEQSFKNALSCWASGVSVVAVRDPRGLSYGLTVSSFSSVSLRPPLVSVCINNANRLAAMAVESKGFAVSILAFGQQDVSNHFASRGREPTEEQEVPCDASPGGHPVVRDASAWVDCELAASHVEGDHTILIGRVRHAHSDEDREPLLYFRRAYRTVTSD